MKKTELLLLITCFIVLLLNGCNGFTPSLPNDEYDEENTELAYIKVIPAKAEMKVNQSKNFQVKAYNSENKLIAIDISKIRWIATYQCLACGVVPKLSPTENSMKTTFTPPVSGNYKVWAKFEGADIKWAKAEVAVE